MRVSRCNSSGLASRRARGGFWRKGATLAAAALIALALPLLLASEAMARAGGGGSSGSRGSRTFSSPSTTRTAPSSAQPMQRTTTQPSGSPSQSGSSITSTGSRTNTSSGGIFSRPGFWGGIATGFLGAGLLGMMTGQGFMGGVGGFASFLGLILQIILVVVVVRLALRWWRSRNAPALVGAGAGPGGAMTNLRDAMGGAGGDAQGGAQGDVALTEDDFNAFERLLGAIQQAYSAEDLNTLKSLATAEMVSYFAEDLAANASRGVVNRVSDVRLLQGDLSEAWSEGDTDYATVAMRFSLVDQMLDRASGRVVEGGATPQEVVEVWTFRRTRSAGRNGQWLLSAIQTV